MMVRRADATIEETQKLLMNIQKYAEGYHRPEEPKITLSTIHSAKGLEWKNVFVLKYKKLKEYFDSQDINKNLAYVAITRAKDIVLLDEGDDREPQSEEESAYEQI